MPHTIPLRSAVEVYSLLCHCTVCVLKPIKRCSVQRRQAMEEMIAVIALWPSIHEIFINGPDSPILIWLIYVYILYRRLYSWTSICSCEHHWSASALLPDRPAWALWAWFPGANLSGAFYTLHLGSAFNTLKNIAFFTYINYSFYGVYLTNTFLFIPTFK